MPTPDQLTTDKKIAVLIAEGLEEVEALAVVDLLAPKIGRASCRERV